MTDQIQSVISFHDRHAERLKIYIASECRSLIKDLQSALEKMEQPDYTPPADGLIRGCAARIDGDCARLATMREMLGTLRSAIQPE